MEYAPREAAAADRLRKRDKRGLYMTDKEKLLSLYSKLSERDKRLIIRVMENMKAAYTRANITVNNTTAQSTKQNNVK